MGAERSWRQFYNEVRKYCVDILGMPKSAVKESKVLRVILVGISNCSGEDEVRFCNRLKDLYLKGLI